MKILVFGANGRTGKYVVDLLSQHEVIKFDKDILDEDAVEKAVRSCDAVISVIGHKRGSIADMQTKGISNVIKSMDIHGLKRIISLTGTGVRFPGDKITSFDRIMNYTISLIDQARVSDGKKHVEQLKKSRLDWTVLRVLKLTDGPKTDKWRLTLNGPVKTLISRRDVASAINQILEKDLFIRQAPIISKR